MKGFAQRGNQLAYGSFGIKALESTWITGRQIEAARQAITRYMKREGQIWIRIFPDKPITILSINLLLVVSSYDGKCHSKGCGYFYRGRFACNWCFGSRERYIKWYNHRF